MQSLFHLSPRKTATNLQKLLKNNVNYVKNTSEEEYFKKQVGYENSNKDQRKDRHRSTLLLQEGGRTTDIENSDYYASNLNERQEARL